MGITDEQIHCWTEQLYREYDQICYTYRLRLKKPTIRITHSESYWALWNPKIRQICLNQRLLTEHAWDVVIEILKHEMAHQLIHEELLLNDASHGPTFQATCQRLGMAPWAKKATGDLSKELGRDTQEATPDEAKVLKRIEKLLAMSSSDNEHEAFLAMKEARRLSRAHDLAQIREFFEKDHWDFLSICHKKKIIPQHQSLLASILTSFYQVEVVFSSTFDTQTLESYKTLEILGLTKDIKLAEYIYHFVWNKLPILWKQYKDRKASNRRSFYLGVLNGLYEKHKKDSQNDHKKSLASTDLVTQKKLIAQKASNTRHPRTQNKSYSSDRMLTQSYEDGFRQGIELDIRKGVSSGSAQHLLADRTSLPE